jgi:hypothetical protein
MKAPALRRNKGSQLSTHRCDGTATIRITTEAGAIKTAGTRKNYWSLISIDFMTAFLRISAITVFNKKRF